MIKDRSSSRCLARTGTSGTAFSVECADFPYFLCTPICSVRYTRRPSTTSSGVSSVPAYAVYCDCTYGAFAGRWSCCMTANFQSHPPHRCTVSYPIFMQSGMRPQIPSSGKLPIAYENLSCLLIPHRQRIFAKCEDPSSRSNVIPTHTEWSRWQRA